MNAKQIYYIILTTFAVAGTWLSNLMGGWDHLTALLAWVMAVDYVTGWLCAAVWHKSPKTESGGYESRVGFKGLLRKGVIVLIVMIASELDKLTGSQAMRTATILFFAANDGMSILENLGIMGVPYPPVLKNAFEVLRRKSEDKGDGDDVPTVGTDYQGKHDLEAKSPYADFMKDDVDDLF